MYHHAKRVVHSGNGIKAESQGMSGSGRGEMGQCVKNQLPSHCKGTCAQESGLYSKGFEQVVGVTKNVPRRGTEIAKLGFHFVWKMGV